MSLQSKCFAGLAAVLAISAGCTGPVQAQALTSRPVLTLAYAERIIAAAEADATKNGCPGVIAVTDDQGQLIAMVRMDNAAVPAGVDLASGKARTAALFRRPTSDLENAINGPRHALVTAGNFVMLTGGLPIVDDGQVVGAIGVSTATPQHDEQVAEAGVAAFNQDNSKP